ALVYPGKENSNRSGNYLDKIKNKDIIDKECSVLLIPVEKDIKEWQTAIQKKLLVWFNENKTKASS
ncbi:MAG: hypothetical protein WAV86_14605, partial [Lutibacter sp.]